MRLGRYRLWNNRLTYYGKAKKIPNRSSNYFINRFYRYGDNAKYLIYARYFDVYWRRLPIKK
jgi:hypothetical protein